MDVSFYIHSTYEFLFFFFHSWRGKSQSDFWNVRLGIAAKTLLPWENGHLLPFKSCVWMRSECAWGSETCWHIWVFDSIFGPLKSVLIFHHGGFYGTDSIHENPDGHDLIFQVQVFVMCIEKDRTVSPWTQSASVICVVVCHRKAATGQWEASLTSVYEWTPHFSVRQLPFVREMQNPFKRHIAIKFEIEAYMMLSLPFFYCYSCKKNQTEKKTVTWLKTCCTRNLSICIWIMNTLKMLQICSFLFLLTPFRFHSVPNSFCTRAFLLFPLLL